MLLKIIRLFYFYLLLVLSAFSFCALDAGLASGNEIVDRIVAVVNDDIITYLDLQKEMQPYEDKIRISDYSSDEEKRMLEKVRSEVLNRMIDERLAEQEARKNNITISEAEIDNSIENIKAANNWNDESFKAMLERRGISLEEYRKSVKENGMRVKLVNSAVKSAIVVTKEDAQAYYEAHRERYAGELHYHLEHITTLVPKGATDEAQTSLRQKMEKIYDELQAGVSFETMVQKYSQASNGIMAGDLGSVNFADIAPQLQAAVKSLAIGEYTPVIQTDRGYQIFYVQNIERIGGKTFEEARSEIEQKLYDEMVDEKFVSWLRELRNNAHIKIYQ
jgi:peptidyl-prolyl cis-trans isomerase SurA